MSGRRADRRVDISADVHAVVAVNVGNDRATGNAATGNAKGPTVARSTQVAPIVQGEGGRGAATEREEDDR